MTLSAPYTGLTCLDGRPRAMLIFNFRIDFCEPDKKDVARGDFQPLTARIWLASR
jgi:hypothetical protein